MTTQSYTVAPIGTVQMADGMFRIEVDAAYRAGLLKIGAFSHVIVFWWATGTDNAQDRATLTEKLYYADNIEAGVFACRTPRRPNPIAMSVCPIVDVDENAGTITVGYIDAEPGTPVIDLKPYIGMSDRVKSLNSASWFAGFPEWIPESAGDIPDWVMERLMREPEE